jgi:hypothetical protein
VASKPLALSALVGWHRLAVNPVSNFPPSLIEGDYRREFVSGAHGLRQQPPYFHSPSSDSMS